MDVNNLASGDRETPTLCGSVWNERGIVSFRAGMMAKVSMPRPTPFIAAGYLFARGTMLEEVPFDPDLPQVRARACLHVVLSRQWARLSAVQLPDAAVHGRGDHARRAAVDVRLGLLLPQREPGVPPVRHQGVWQDAAQVLGRGLRLPGCAGGAGRRMPSALATPLCPR